MVSGFEVRHKKKGETWSIEKTKHRCSDFGTQREYGFGVWKKESMS